MIRAAGVFDALTAMHHCRFETLNWALVHSTSDEQWYKDCYADVGLPSAPTSYMHFDHAFRVPKMIFYLVDVDQTNGPFSIVPYTGNYLKNYSQLVLWKFMDWHADQMALKEPRFDVRYRRRRYKFPELRKELMRLPNQMRGTSHFGEDILEGTPLSKELLAQEVVCYSEVSNCIIFDGGATTHRGGLVSKGERWAFQMGFERVGGL